MFVEVKTRIGAAFGSGTEAITGHKQRRIVAVALDYVARHRLTDLPCRFDVVAVTMASDGAVVEVIPGAFDAG